MDLWYKKRRQANLFKSCVPTGKVVELIFFNYFVLIVFLFFLISG